jgi:hypothetical protein
LRQPAVVILGEGERMHDGKFLRLLKELAPDKEKCYAEGARKVEEEIAKKKA